MIGAGIVGLARADELVRVGHDVHLFDPEPGAGATRAAAGMLSPAGEAWHGETDLLRLGVASARLWPTFARRLESTSGLDVDLRRQGTILVGHDHDDLQHVGRSLDVLRHEGLPFAELDAQQVRIAEPTLARVAGGVRLPDDHHVDPRRVVEALLRVLATRVVRARASVDDTGVVTEDGRRWPYDTVVVATGVDVRGSDRPVRPVMGETVRLRTDDPPSCVLRARVAGERVYLVPRADGEVVVGASEEEHDAAPVARLGSVVRLLHAARTLVPGLETAEVVEVTARHRPGTPDNGPLLGVVEDAGPVRQVMAAGHYRGGVLLAPLTAQVVRACVEGDDVPAVARPFAPDRFAAPAHRPMKEYTA